MRQIAPAVYKLRKTIKNLLQPEAHYLLAVSGGADSLALAHACAALAAQGWGSYSVCHVEHGLRGEEALRDMQAVQRACKDWGLPCFTEHVQAASYAAQNRLSTEDAARRLRYAALRRIAEQQGAASRTCRNAGAAGRYHQTAAYVAEKPAGGILQRRRHCSLL